MRKHEPVNLFRDSLPPWTGLHKWALLLELECWIRKYGYWLP